MCVFIRRRKGVCKHFFCWLVIITGIVLLQPNVYAQVGGIGGRPAFPCEDNPRTESIFVYTLDPGQTKSDGIRIINNADERKTIMVYATDSAVASGGSFTCKQFAQPKYGVGTWIDLEKSEVTLDPDTNEIVPFTITVPNDAGVGEHNGCIVVQEKKEKTGEETGITLSFRTGLRVAVTVPGVMTRSLEIVNFSVEKNEEGDFLLQPAVRNLGNVSIDADVLVKTRYFFGSLLETHGGQFPILRGQTSSWNFKLTKPKWGGFYKSQLIVEYDENINAGVGVRTGGELTKLTSEPVWFFSMPSTQALIVEGGVLLALIVLLVLFIISRWRKKWIAKNWVGYEVSAGEDIKSVAEKFDVSWKLLAKANKLEPPYSLQPGQELKVPPQK